MSEHCQLLAGELDNLLLSSLQPCLALRELPDPAPARAALGPDSSAYSRAVLLSPGTAPRSVISTLERAGQTWLAGCTLTAKHSSARALQLVRPDSGWFPGLDSIR